MPNHVHFVVVPNSEEVLSKFFCEIHKRYARRTNSLNEWTGHLWQQRFFSVVMNDSHALNALRYVEWNPVRAGLAKKACDWPWSSARANLGLSEDPLVDIDSSRAWTAEQEELLALPIPSEEADEFRVQTRTGRPDGDDSFIDTLETLSGRKIRRQKRGRKVEKG